MKTGTLIELKKDYKLDVLIEGTAYLGSEKECFLKGNSFRYSGSEFSEYMIFEPINKNLSHLFEEYSTVKSVGVMIPPEVIEKYCTIKNNSL